MFQATLRRLAQERAAEIEGEEAAEAGFTLIELMVVLLIIAILLAIAIPTFLGVTNTAGDRAAQSNLTNAITEAKALYQVTSRTPKYERCRTPRVIHLAGAGIQLANVLGSAVRPRRQLRELLVFDVSTAGDGQGLSLAVDSAKTNTCWYALRRGVDSRPSASPVAGPFANCRHLLREGRSFRRRCTALNPDSPTPR